MVAVVVRLVALLAVTLTFAMRPGWAAPAPAETPLLWLLPRAGEVVPMTVRARVAADIMTTTYDAQVGDPLRSCSSFLFFVSYSLSFCANCLVLALLRVSAYKSIFPVVVLAGVRAAASEAGEADSFTGRQFFFFSQVPQATLETLANLFRHPST